MTNKDMKDHLKDLSMNMSKAVQDYAATTNKLATHITALNEAYSVQLKQIKRLETENKELTEICGGVAHYEKKIKEFIKKESVDN